VSSRDPSYVSSPLGKGETRTDWRRRPLSDRQIDYALRDVVYLVQIRDMLVERLEALKRADWLETELDRWQSAIETAELGPDGFENLKNEVWSKLKAGMAQCVV